MYLVGSVVAAAMVNPMLLRVGARSSYLMGLAVFGVASLVCGTAPSMEVLIAGRTLQGVAGGLLAGLGYAVINSALPRSLWTRGSALVSAMWGVATLVGPATGGLFAQFGLWRWAFVTMAILTALMALLVPSGAGRGPRRAERRCDADGLQGAGVVIDAARRCGAGGQRRRRFRATVIGHGRAAGRQRRCWSACS